MKTEAVNSNMIADGHAFIYNHKIVNGSAFSIGTYTKTILFLDKHFNWFQKLMWKWCFGIKVTDYTEE